MIFRLDVDVAIYRDRVQVTDRKTGLFVDYRAEYPFSDGSTLIAEPRFLEHALSHSVRKLLKGGFVLFQPRAHVTHTEFPLSPTERERLRKSLYETGFKRITFADLGEK